MKLIDRSGERYGRLVVVSRAPNKSERDTNARWHVKCDCGNETIAYGGDLRRGKVKSCGCMSRERIGEYAANRPGVHRMSKTRAYRKWQHMLNRCSPNAEPKKRKRYFERGIKVCERWKKFENFLADMGLPPERMSLDRINNDGDYEPSNCRWANAVQQARNRENKALMLTYKGVTMTLTEWSRHLGIDRSTLYSRIHRGKSLDEIFAHSL